MREGVDTKADYQLQSDISFDFVFRELIPLIFTVRFTRQFYTKMLKDKRMALYISESGRKYLLSSQT